MIANIEDVARLAGVARSTVSNVINRPEIVAEATRLRVQNAMDMLGYVPNESARVLAGGMGRFVGMVVHDASNPFFGEMARAVEDIALERDYVVTLTSTGAEPGREDNALRLLMRQRAQGVLLTTTAMRATSVASLRGIGTRVVLLDTPGGPEECSVSVDDVDGGRLVGTHFLDCGYRQMAFAGRPARTTQHGDRLAGLRQTLAGDSRGRGVHVQEILVAADDVASGREVAATIAKGDLSSPLAVLCGNDLIAMGLMFGLQELGIDVPGQVAICGYDDIDLAQYLAIPLTTVRQPMAEMGRTAFELLLSEVTDTGHVHEARRFAPELVVRGSTTP
ncbi:LacI family transcriptional regulator [Kribbella aluminosa]|uniref:LacI family transcriptional regulator n=1 Tax=Kribbella aluminosa TaxID=416017 RepID=A0ABS4UJ03_9ACTN|nr:LacI family DNA-binding transcriptional regulator [Kribbella aluminosa]MBP2351623.1 LacI family transcriptional regulator [Kribbella aluminosa]